LDGTLEIRIEEFFDGALILGMSPGIRIDGTGALSAGSAHRAMV